MRSFNILSLLLITLFLSSCGSDKVKIHEVAEEPILNIINENMDHDFSIVLDDMDIEMSDKLMTYKHKYVVLKVLGDSLAVDSTDFMPVGAKYFQAHEKDLGMEIISRHNGQFSSNAAPVGYGWAIGNPLHGDWVSADSTAVASMDGNTTSTSSGSNSERHWRPRGSSFLFWYWMLRRPATFNDYSGYRNANGRGKSYYGRTRSGAVRHGTASAYQRSTRSGFYSRAGSNQAWSEHRTRKSSSSSRYGKGSSTRSRSGGMGK